MTPTKSWNPFRLAREAGRQEASGYVAQDNVEDVRLWLLDLLLPDGEPSTYTWVSSYEYAGYRPEVRTGQKAEKVQMSDVSSSVTVIDTYGIWSLDGGLLTQPAASASDDPLRKSSFVTLSDHHMQAQIRTPEKRLAWWHVELERS